MIRPFFLAVGLALLVSPALSQSSSRPDERDSWHGVSDDERGTGRVVTAQKAPVALCAASRSRRASRTTRYRRASRPCLGGAQFTIRTGNDVVDARCRAGETSRECGDTAIMVLERVRSLRPAANSGTGPGSTQPPR